MARFPSKRLPYKKQDELWSLFCEVLSQLDTREEIQRFLKDLLNRQERLMFIRRLQIAQMLEEGRTYRDIMKELGAGPATIGRIQRWLEFGRDGYKRAIKKLTHLETRK